MAELIAVNQQSEAWHKIRATSLGSSDSCVIAGSVDWSTPYKLWLEKTGQIKPEFKTNFAIERGLRFEGIAKLFVETKLDIEFEPQVFRSNEHPFMIASLDGWNDEHKLILEIKCVSARPVLDEALEGRVHEKYRPQLIHQCIVTGAERAVFFVCLVEKRMGEDVITENAVVEFKPTQEEKEKLLKLEYEFHNNIKTLTRPQLTNDDVLIVSDEFSKESFKALREAKDKPNFKELKVSTGEYMIKEYQHHKIRCEGTLLSKNEKGVWSVRFS